MVIFWISCLLLALLGKCGGTKRVSFYFSLSFAFCAQKIQRYAGIVFSTCFLFCNFNCEKEENTLPEYNNTTKKRILSPGEQHYAGHCCVLLTRKFTRTCQSIYFRAVGKNREHKKSIMCRSLLRKFKEK